MTKPKMTPWFPPKKKPFRHGVYQTEDDFDRTPAQFGYQYWNGRYWGQFCDTPMRAASYANWRSMFQDNHWRGLASEPKKVGK